MSSAYRDRDGSGWIADFRPLHGAGRQRRRVRVPYDRLPDPPTHERDARAFADECDHYCRLLEVAPTPEQIRHARSLGAISQAQFDALRGGFPAPAVGVDPFAPPTLAQLADQHPSSAREAETDPADARKHRRRLAEFCGWAQISDAQHLTLRLAQDWVAELRSRGLAWDSRRHYLLPLRRAAAMLPTLGLPDPLAGWRLDHQDSEHAPVRSWTFGQLIQAVPRLQAADPRALAVLGLGGFAGLRASEIQRLRCGDLDGDVLRIGERQRKTAASRRDLPVPAVVASWLAPLARGADPDRLLILPLSPRPSQHGHVWSCSSWAHWLSPLLAQATGRALPPKCLRASFATLAIRHAQLPTHVVERYLGHQRSDVAAVTHRHYLAEAAIAELRPHAERLDQLIRDALAREAPGVHGIVSTG